MRAGEAGDVQLFALTGHLREFAWSVQFFSRGAKEMPGAGGELKREFAKSRAQQAVRRGLLRGAVFVVLAFAASSVLAQSCLTSSDMDSATRTALTGTALRYFNFVAAGDAASLRQNSIPSLAADFSSIESTVKDNQGALAGAKASARPSFLLEAEGAAALAHAEFYCGVFGSKGQTRDSAVFSLSNLAPGKYGVVILDASASKGAFTVSLILQQQGSEWKLGGLYIQAAQLAGHDSDWFIARAKEFQAKGQKHNAWLYYIEAISLVSPLPFIGTKASDDLNDEAQKVLPADIPADEKTAELSMGATAGATAGTAAAAAGAANYKLTALFPQAVGDDLDLIVKYQASDISNSNQTYQNNIAVMKVLVAKFPELRGAFAGIVARAVDPSGRDYGTMLAMKEIK